MNIRSANETDIPGILRLVNDHARRGEVLPRTALSIRDTLDDWLVGEDGGGDIVACVSLLYYTSALAEVRSLAVHDKVKGQGWGQTIVKALIAQAKLRHVPTLFALTRAVPFFQKMGFSISAMERFPEKVWRDCFLCPVRHKCDETAVVLQLFESGVEAEQPRPEHTSQPKRTNARTHFLPFVRKEQVALRFAELVYFGKWYHTLRESMQVSDGGRTRYAAPDYSKFKRD